MPLKMQISVVFQALNLTRRLRGDVRALTLLRAVRAAQMIAQQSKKAAHTYPTSPHSTIQQPIGDFWPAVCFTDVVNTYSGDTTMVSEHTGGWRTLSTRNAFLIHLALSLLIFMTLVAVMVTLWFPGELFFLDGGWEGLKLVALVDLVLGPALTLCLYKPGKKGLVMDMSIIAGVQIAALAYGFVTTFEQRTVAVVYAENNFNTLSNVALIKANKNLTERKIETKAIASLDNRIPATLVTDESRTSELIQDLLNGFPQIHERTDKFKTAKNNADYLRDKTVSEATIEKEDKEGLVKKALAKQKSTADIGVHRFKARYGSGFALFDYTSGRIVDYIKIDAETAGAKTNLAESVE